MENIQNALITWGIVVLVTAVLSFIGYKYLSQVSRYEIRKPEIRWAAILITLIVATFMFLPILFLSYIGVFQPVCQQIYDSMNNIRQNSE